MLFILAGTVMGGWQGRIPSVRAQLGVGDGAWGLIVLGMPMGTLLALLVLQGVITRTGARLPARWGAAVLLMIAPLAAASPSTLPVRYCGALSSEIAGGGTTVPT